MALRRYSQTPKAIDESQLLIHLPPKFVMACCRDVFLLLNKKDKQVMNMRSDQ